MKLFITLLVIVPISWVLLSFYGPGGPTIGRSAPAFTVKLIEGKERRLKDLRGKVVLLNFWASWCPPCRAEAGDLEAAWKEYKDRDVVFLGINVQSDKAKDAHRFIREFGITFPNGWDNGTISDSYGVWGIPRTFIIGPKGRIMYIHKGRIRSATIADKLGEARRGLISAKEGEGSYQSIEKALEEMERKTNRLEETVLERNRIKEKELQLKEKYRKINVQTVKNYEGQWVKIILKDGSERKGNIIDVKEEVIQLQQSFASGSFYIQVPIQQIEDIRLLVVDRRANIAQ